MNVLENSHLMASRCSVEQLPLHREAIKRPVLAVVLGSLAMGGAERIVLDWASASKNAFTISICVIHDCKQEWTVPDGIQLTRLGGRDIHEGLRTFAQTIARAWSDIGFGKPPVLCHITRVEHRTALEAGGMVAVPVLHNARQGWMEHASCLERTSRVIAVSQACVDDLRAEGISSDVSLIRHLPTVKTTQRVNTEGMRTRLAATLRIQCNRETKLIAMIGGIKSQKNYPKALAILQELLTLHDAYLVIFGGPIGKGGQEAWNKLRGEILAMGLGDRVRVTGFIDSAAQYLPAFDVFLNTSLYEGLSIATLEALLMETPAVAADVGGQGELNTQGLRLIATDAAISEWTKAIESAWNEPISKPYWKGFPSHRLWTLEHLACSKARFDHTVFVTANLNSGGAQRSLTNLACAINGSASIEIAVCGDSTTSYFAQELEAADVKVSRASQSRDCFDQAEALMKIIGGTGCKAVCFWNVDPKVKLLVAKVAARDIALIDVSPGGYAFEEMEATRQFQQLVGFSMEQFYARLTHLVLKYDSEVPRYVTTKRSVIRNGVRRIKQMSGLEMGSSDAPRIIVNGRIAPSKFIVEIAQAMDIVWKVYPRAHLHIVGTAEERHADYLALVNEAVQTSVLNNRGCSGATMHGALFNIAEVATPADIAVVLGHHQGCPNAVLEAMAAGLCVAANASGGTTEIVRHDDTGIVIPGTEPAHIARELCNLLGNPLVRTRLARAGLRHVSESFSMDTMRSKYIELFNHTTQIEVPQC